MKITDLKIIVTGAASGLGASAARFLAREGAQVAGLDINEEGLESLSKELAGEGHELLPLVADITDEKAVVAAVARANDAFGGANALINSAGIYRDGLLVHPDGRKMPLAQWRKTIEVDLTGTFLTVRELAASMVRNKISPGVIINVASVSRHGNIAQGNYSAAKAGVVASSRTWARELAQYGIRVAVVSPGFMRTPCLSPDLLDPKVLESYVARVPLGRIGEPREIDSAIRFVLDCDYFTGEVVEVNGGFYF